MIELSVGVYLPVVEVGVEEGLMSVCWEGGGGLPQSHPPPRSADIPLLTHFLMELIYGKKDFESFYYNL